MVRFALAGQHLPGSPSVLGVRLTKEKARITGGLGDQVGLIRTYFSEAGLPGSPCASSATTGV